MNKKLNSAIYLVKGDLKLFFSLSFGSFLFVLFFYPFPLEKFDFNDRLIFVAGLGGIVFLFLFLTRIIFYMVRQSDYQNDYEPTVPYFLLDFSFLSLTSVAFAFYLHFVGSVTISFLIMFRVVFLCLAPPVVTRIRDVIKVLNQQIETLITENKLLQRQIEKNEEGYLNKTIEFTSTNKSENLNLTVSNVAFLKSADNYVEIVYKEDNMLKKTLIRNTLRNIELQIKPYANFVKCHRICIVNTFYVDNLRRNINTYWITIKGCSEKIPVSRQYLMKLKEMI